jgi:hypothetical protein
LLFGAIFHDATLVVSRSSVQLYILFGRLGNLVQWDYGTWLAFWEVGEGKIAIPIPIEDLEISEFDIDFASLTADNIPRCIEDKDVEILVVLGIGKLL